MAQGLADELVVMMADDQRLLQRLFEAGELPSASYHPRMKALHERNAARLKAIIGRHGWPGISLVGEEAVDARRAALGMNALEERLAQMIEGERRRREKSQQNG